MRERERERGRDTGRGRSRLHAGSLTWDRVSRIMPWAEAGAKPRSHPGIPQKHTSDLCSSLEGVCVLSLKSQKEQGVQGLADGLSSGRLQAPDLRG